MTPDQFLTRCRSLWHVAPAGAWDQISQHGFRTAEQLIRMADLDDETRTRLLTEPRREPIHLKVDGAEVLIRDQASLFGRADLAAGAEAALGVADWVKLLNQRVYLFTTMANMGKMLDKYVALEGALDVLTLSPMRVLEAARPQIELTTQNSGGMTRKAGQTKGATTFMPFWRFPDRVPTEVTLIDGLTDMAVVVMAERHHADGTREVLHR